MNQLFFADTEFTSKRRKTRKELFLSRMDELIPWQQLEAQIEPFYPKAGNGRRPYPLSTMLRIHFMQNWYSMVCTVKHTASGSDDKICTGLIRLGDGSWEL